MNENNCLVCSRIQAIKTAQNPHFVCELPTSYVVLADSQFYYGYTLLLSKYHVCELHELSAETRSQYLAEMAMVAEAVFEVFQPLKLNYELLGNKHPHLHWHLIPRYADDPNPAMPVWVVDDCIRNASFLAPELLKNTINNLADAILNK